MSFFQNPLDADLNLALVLADKQMNISFKVDGNSPNSSTLLQAWNPGPYDVSTNKILTINYSFDCGNSWTVLTISDVGSTALNTSAATAYEIIAALNANTTFAALFTAVTNTDRKGNIYPVIKALRAREKFKCYITNTGAEIPLRFNKKAGVSELPTFFARHTIANKNTYPDSLGMLIQLDLTTTRDQQIVTDAGFGYVAGFTNADPTVTIPNTLPFAVGDSVEVFNGTTSLARTISSITPNVSLTLNSNWTGSTGSGRIVVIHADYQLLRGRSGLFTFKKQTVDGSSRITEIIEYPAGALVGDFAKKTTYTYTAAQTSPDKIIETPYCLGSSDLVIP